MRFAVSPGLEKYESAGLHLQDEWHIIKKVDINLHKKQIKFIFCIIKTIDISRRG